MPKDPVCGMQVRKDRAITEKKQGKNYYFCSERCKNQFLSGKEGDTSERQERHKGAASHSEHHAHMVEDFKKRFWISIILTIPILILSPLIQTFFGYSIEFPGSMFVLFVLSSIVYFYGGWPFLQGLKDELKKKQPGMMTLIALAISVAYFYSSAVVFGIPGEVFFWELVTLIDVMLLGHWIEMKSLMGASRALEELAKLMPQEAHRLDKNQNINDVKIADLKKDDKVLVKPGEKIPVDGIVIDGESEVNQAMLTGESKPVSKKSNDDVIGGSINGSGALQVRVNKMGRDSYLAQVIDLVKAASESKSKAQGFANKVAFWLTIIALTVGISTFFTWIFFDKTFVFALERMVTVMVITCPHALGLAIPLVIAAITAISAQNGLLIRNRPQFETARKIDTVVFDKTGTLTKGEFGVTDIVSFNNWEQEEILKLAASLETNSEHSIAKGIVNKAKINGLKFSESKRFQAISGKGAKGIVDDKEIFIGNKEILDVAKIKSVQAQKKADELAAQGKTVVFVALKNEVQGIIALADIIREESKEAIRLLKKRGIEASMITGDNKSTAEYVANQLGINSFFAEVLPDKKSEKIKELQKKKKRVAMVGDGVNDAPALAQADLGIAIGAGTDVAVQTADVVLTENDPRSVADIFELSKLTQRKTLQNLVWATGYNVIAIPLAAGVLYNQGIVLPPAVGAVVMSLSTIVVAINARIIKFEKHKANERM